MNILPERGISFKEKLVFTKHVATMTMAGIPLLETLDTVKQYTKKGYFKDVIVEIMKDIENGSSLETSLRKFPAVFGTFYIGMVEIGEQSGTLAENLKFLSEQLTKEYQLRSKIRSALAYPAVVVTAMVIMGTFISLFILPRLVDFFGSFEIDLPITTKTLLFVSVIMRDYGVLLFGFGVILIILFRLAIRSSEIKPIWHIFLLKVPLIGKLILYGQIASFGRGMGVLLKSGVTAIDALKITSDSLYIVKFKKDLLDVARQLDGGRNMGETLEDKKYWQFPPMVSRMVRVGEQSGKLEETFNYIGDFYEDEIDSLSKNLSTMLEPALLVVIGLGVGYLALAIISPIYELTGSIR